MNPSETGRHGGAAGPVPAADPPRALAGGLDPDSAMRLARHVDAAVRQALAARPDLAPELLFFLAADPDDGVRGAVAGNAGTPGKADGLLAGDATPSVRVRLAEKAAARLPRDGTGDPGPLDRLTREVLDRLAADPDPAVRRVLSEALADLAQAPATAVRHLAADPLDLVAVPVLARSPQLGEEDLAALVAEAPAPGARRAIAGRPKLGSRVADAIAASGDPAAITVLLANGGAQLREATLDRLLDDAPAHPAWHAPLVRRPELGDAAVARLAGFVADALVAELERRPGLGPAAAAAIAAVRPAGARSAAASGPPAPDSGGGPDGGTVGAEPAPSPAGRGLDDDALDAAVLAGDRRTVIAALAADAGLPIAAVERVLASRSAGAVCGLARRAGRPMRLAAKIQLRIAGIPAARAMVPGPDGVYPLAPEELERLLAVALGDG